MMKKNGILSWVSRYIILGLSLGVPCLSQAISVLPRTVSQNQFSVGTELEWGFDRFGFDNESALGTELRSSYGWTDAVNFFGGLGVFGRQGGSHFFVGTLFDLFPSTLDQPGFGVALTASKGFFKAQYGLLKPEHFGSTRLEAMPYVHQVFEVWEVTFEPFLAFPFSSTLFWGKYPSGPSLVLGSLFDHQAGFASHLELGLSLGETAYHEISVGLTRFF